MLNKKFTIYYGEGFEENDILGEAIEQLKEWWEDETTKKSAKETFGCEGEELSKFEITITVEDKSGY